MDLKQMTSLFECGLFLVFLFSVIKAHEVLWIHLHKMIKICTKCYIFSILQLFPLIICIRNNTAPCNVLTVINEV